MKRHTTATTREISALLEMKYAAVAKAYQRIVKEMAEDEQLRSKVEEFDKRLSFVEG